MVGINITAMRMFEESTVINNDDYLECSEDQMPKINILRETITNSKSDNQSSKNQK